MNGTYIEAGRRSHRDVPIATSKRIAFRLSDRQAILFAWFAAGIVMLASLGAPPVERTQEARVLEIAQAVEQQFGPRAYCFYRCQAAGIGFALRSEIPVVRSEAELQPHLQRDNSLILIVRDQPDEMPEKPPEGFVQRLTFSANEGDVKFYERERVREGILVDTSSARVADPATWK